MIQSKASPIAAPSKQALPVSAGYYEKLKCFCREGRLHECLPVVHAMLHKGLPLSTSIFYCLLQGCIQKKDPAAGRTLYSYIRRTEHRSNGFLGTHLIHMFASCGCLLDANQVFRDLPQPDVFAWTAIISVHVRHGHHERAIDLYKHMCRSAVVPDGHAFVAVLNASAGLAAAKDGHLVHTDIIYAGVESEVLLKIESATRRTSSLIRCLTIAFSLIL